MESEDKKLTIIEKRLNHLSDAFDKLKELFDEVYKELNALKRESTLVKIDGVIETPLSCDAWLDQFIFWLESRGEYFGGGTTDVTHSDDDKMEETE